MPQISKKAEIRVTFDDLRKALGIQFGAVSGMEYWYADDTKTPKGFRLTTEMIDEVPVSTK